MAAIFKSSVLSRAGARALALTVVLAAATASAAAEVPVYKKGVVTCPGGDTGRLAVPAFSRPSLAQMSGLCLSLQSKRLQAAEPLQPVPSMSRDEINRQAAPLIRKPR